MKPCELYDDCENEISDQSRTGLCKNCGAARSRWRKIFKLRPAQVMKRRQNLRLYSNRLDELVIVGKVTHIKSKRKAA